ncbi:MAG: hypothetical protein L0Y37_07160, partial [Bacteroidales bacterium]|nr:hypothetical protein [Bacteroidales bacterium]
MKKLIPVYLILALLLSSCLVGRRYSRPEMQYPDAYMSADSVAAVPDTASPYIEADSTINLQWFDLFGDTVLNELITMALDSNT